MIALAFFGVCFFVVPVVCGKMSCEAFSPVPRLLVFVLFWIGGRRRDEGWEGEEKGLATCIFDSLDISVCFSSETIVLYMRHNAFRHGAVP